MTTPGLTYIVADIVGSSLILQQDQRKGVDLFETFQSLLVPVIEKAVGFGIEITGDAISASFKTCKSAVSAGFAIQKALKVWNHSSEGPGLVVRIGIHSSLQGDKESQQQLSLAAATCLQSLGRSDALCVSRAVIDEVSPELSVYAYPMGHHDLGFLPNSVPVFYLYEEKQAFLRRQGFLLEYLKTEYLDSIKSALISPAVEIPLLAVATLFFLTFVNGTPEGRSEGKSRHIEVAEIRNYSSNDYSKYLGSMKERVRTFLEANTGAGFRPDATTGNESDAVLPAGEMDKRHPAFRLVFSFQENTGHARLTWGLFQQQSSDQISGGVVTGSINNLPELEQEMTGDILKWLGY